MGDPNSFTWGTRDKFGNVFGVPLSRGEKAMMRAAWGKPPSIKNRQGTSVRLRNRKPTKVAFKFLETD